jgi:putrescine aminotransferase
MQRQYPDVLTEARGKGLLLGLEFPSDSIGYRFAAGLFKRGVLVAGTYSKSRTVRIEPALNISMTLLLEVLNRIEDTLKEIAGSLRISANAGVAVA